MIRVRQIKIPILNDNEKYLKKEISKKVKINKFEIVKILHKSIDARNKENILYVYDLVIDVNGKKHKKNEKILPEYTITAKTNSFLYYFNQYAPVVTTVLSIITTTISVIAVTAK